MFGKNHADMIRAVMAGLHPDHRDEWLAMADRGRGRRGEVSLTMLAYLARLPHAEQVEQFDFFRTMGARHAKRYVECLTRPPTREQLVERLLALVTREFPTVDCRLLSEATFAAANLIAEMAAE